MYIFWVALTPEMTSKVNVNRTWGCFFVWQIYLLMGYYYTATEEYDIKWTMPHCVLTLKLIGMKPAFNLPHRLLLRMNVFTNVLFLTIYHKALKSIHGYKPLQNTLLQ